MRCSSFTLRDGRALEWSQERPRITQGAILSKVMTSVTTDSRLGTFDIRFDPSVERKSTQNPEKTLTACFLKEAAFRIALAHQDQPPRTARRSEVLTQA